MTILQKFKDHVVGRSNDANFKYSKWYSKWHLILVEKISLELCSLYKEADEDLVFALVWMHDYAAIIDEAEESGLLKGKNKLLELGANPNFVVKVIEYTKIVESWRSVDLTNAPIEVKIVSSADGASHLVGPFFHIYWYEHPESTLEDILRENNRKLENDWNKKIVLPEVKDIFKARYLFLKEQIGDLPEKFI